MKDTFHKTQELALFNEKTALHAKQEIINKGVQYFIHNRTPEKYMETVHKLDYKSVDKFVKGIKESDYEFYDQYRNIREVLFMGLVNSGKSQLLNALNSYKKAVKVSKNKGKTKQLLFNLVQHEAKKMKGRKGIIIDSPGYGDANVPYEVRHGYRMMLNKYMGYGIRLNLICMCIDASKGVV